MKLLFAVVEPRDLPALEDALTANDFRFTALTGTGGFLRKGNVTLLMGLPDDRIEAALEVFRACCRPREEYQRIDTADSRLYGEPVGQAMPVRVGGAQIFITDLERMVTI